MSKITMNEFNIKLLRDMLKAEKQNNDDIQTENNVLKKSLEFYKDLCMKLSVEKDDQKDDQNDDQNETVRVKKRKLFV